MGNEQSSALDICAHESSNRIKLVKRRYDVDAKPAQAPMMEPRQSPVRGNEKPVEDDPLLKTFNTALRHETKKSEERPTSARSLERYSDNMIIMQHTSANAVQQGRVAYPANTSQSRSAIASQSRSANAAQYTAQQGSVTSNTSQSSSANAAQYTAQQGRVTANTSQSRSANAAQYTAQQGSVTSDTSQIRNINAAQYTAQQGSVTSDTSQSRNINAGQYESAPQESIPKRKQLAPSPTANLRAAPPPPPPGNLRAAPPPPPGASFASAPRGASPASGGSRDASPMAVRFEDPSTAPAQKKSSLSTRRKSSLSSSSSSIPPIIPESSPVAVAPSPSSSRNSSAAPMSSPAARTVSRSNPQILAEKLARARNTPRNSASPMMSPMASPMLSPENSRSPEVLRTSVTKIAQNPAVYSPSDSVQIPLYSSSSGQPMILPGSQFGSSGHFVPAAPQPMLMSPMHGFHPSPLGQGALLPGMMVSM